MRISDWSSDVCSSDLFLADEPAVRPLQLDLRGGIGAVAELLLQALQAQRVYRAVGQEARHQETGEPALRLGQHEEAVAHWRGEEPLVADQDVRLARPRGTGGLGAGGIGAHVGDRKSTSLNSSH